MWCPFGHTWPQYGKCQQRSGCGKAIAIINIVTMRRRPFKIVSGRDYLTVYPPVPNLVANTNKTFSLLGETKTLPSVQCSGKFPASLWKPHETVCLYLSRKSECAKIVLLPFNSIQFVNLGLIYTNKMNVARLCVLLYSLVLLKKIGVLVPSVISVYIHRSIVYT